MPTVIRVKKRTPLSSNPLQTTNRKISSCGSFHVYVSLFSYLSEISVKTHLKIVFFCLNLANFTKYFVNTVDKYYKICYYDITLTKKDVLLAR